MPATLLLSNEDEAFERVTVAVLAVIVLNRTCQKVAEIADEPNVNVPVPEIASILPVETV